MKITDILTLWPPFSTSVATTVAVGPITVAAVECFGIGGAAAECFAIGGEASEAYSVSFEAGA